MDGLAGYGSDSSSDSGTPPITTASAPLSRPSTAAVAPSSTTAASITTSKAVAAATAKSKKSTKRGRKKVLQLSNIIPKEIYDQLTRGEEEGDSDDNDEDGAGKIKGSKAAGGLGLLGKLGDVKPRAASEADFGSRPSGAEAMTATTTTKKKVR